MGLLLALPAGSLFAGAAFSIDTFQTLPEGHRLFSFNAESNAYYLLYRGPEVGLINQAVSICGPVSGMAHLRDTNQDSASAFYRVAAIPLDRPIDSDGDGIDDLTEWRFSPCLDPFNPADAAGDCDGDGRTNLQEYQEGSDPTSAEGGSAEEGGTLVINEIDYDQAGTDNAEFVELLNVSSHTLDLTNLALIFMDGARNAEYRRVALDGLLSPGGYLVIGSSNVLVGGGARVVRFRQASNAIQNGAPDGLALVNLATHRIVDALTYEGAISAGVIDGFPGTYSFLETNPLPAPVADSNGVAGSLIRYPNGTDTQNSAADWQFTTSPTPGTENVLSKAP